MQINKTHFILNSNSVQQIFGRILLWKQKYVYLVEFAMQNIKLAFKLQDWLRFKKLWSFCGMEERHNSILM